jgi:chromate reductase, NAD(P)H dehydrogenase (quinone)
VPAARRLNVHPPVAEEAQMADTIQLLAISGSLRHGSSNMALLQAAALLAADAAVVTFYDGLGALPAFNPDEDGEPPHPAVAAWRAALSAADGLIISTPEYAHGVPGALKNALDWVVGSGELMDKPVALLNASSLSQYAHPQLAETLRVMSAALVDGGSVTVDIPRRGAAGPTVAADPHISAAIRGAMTALVTALTRRSVASGSAPQAPAAVLGSAPIGGDMSAENKALVVRWFDEVWNKGRAEAIGEMFAADGVARGLGDEMRGPEEFKAFHAKFREAMPDLRIEMEELIAEGDRVAYRFTASGTHRGDSLGFAATNRGTRFIGMGSVVIRDGKIVEGWNVLDQLGMLTQLGAIAMPA